MKCTSLDLHNCEKSLKLPFDKKTIEKNREICYNVIKQSIRLISRNLLRRAAAVSVRLHVSQLARLHAQLLTRSARDNQGIMQYLRQ